MLTELFTFKGNLVFAQIVSLEAQTNSLFNERVVQYLQITYFSYFRITIGLIVWHICPSLMAPLGANNSMYKRTSEVNAFGDHMIRESSTKTHSLINEKYNTFFMICNIIDEIRQMLTGFMRWSAKMSAKWVPNNNNNNNHY